MVQPQQAEVAPSIAPLEDVTIEEGEGVRFNTVVIGSPMPTVQWYREGALIPHSRDFEVSTGFLITRNTQYVSWAYMQSYVYEHAQATFIHSQNHLHSQHPHASFHICTMFVFYSHDVYVAFILFTPQKYIYSSREITNFGRLQRVIKKWIMYIWFSKDFESIVTESFYR